jgi:hypothetical protein
MKTTDRERLELLDEFMKNLEKIDHYEAIIAGTRQQIKKYRNDNESILNRMRELDEGLLPFGAQEEPPDPDEEEPESEKQDDNEDVDVEVEQKPEPQARSWLAKGA